MAIAFRPVRAACLMLLICLSVASVPPVGRGEAAGTAGMPEGDAVVEVVVGDATVIAPVPAGFTALADAPKPDGQARVVFNHGLGPRMILTLAPAAAPAENGPVRAGTADPAAAMLDGYRREGLRARVAGQALLDGGGRGTAFFSFSARKECKPYNLGGLDGSLVAGGVALDFTLRLFQGDPEADEALAAAWLRRFYAIN